MLPNRHSNKRKTNTQSKFSAMSKLIGIFIAIVLVIIIIYSMYEMHHQNDLSSLSQLLISVFGVCGIYVGFYLTMAKWEHIAVEKTLRQKDLLKLKKKLELYDEKQECEEDIEKMNDEINDLDSQSSIIEHEEINTNF